MVERFWDRTMISAETDFIIHEHPVWRGRADFVINAELREEDRPKQFEQLWTRQIREEEFQICCIPFFIYDVALGDIVTTVPKRDRRYIFDHVLQRSERYVFRVWFGESFHPREAVVSELRELGALLEWSSINLLAVDAEDHSKAQAIANYLEEREQRRELIFETGRSA